MKVASLLTVLLVKIIEGDDFTYPGSKDDQKFPGAYFITNEYTQHYLYVETSGSAPDVRSAPLELIEDKNHYFRFYLMKNHDYYNIIVAELGYTICATRYLVRHPDRYHVSVMADLSHKNDDKTLWGLTRVGNGTMYFKNKYAQGYMYGDNYWDKNIRPIATWDGIFPGMGWRLTFVKRK